MPNSSGSSRLRSRQLKSPRVAFRRPIPLEYQVQEVVTYILSTDQRSAAVSSEALASTQVFSLEVLPHSDSTCFQNGARVFR